MKWARASKARKDPFGFTSGQAPTPELVRQARPSSCALLMTELFAGIDTHKYILENPEILDKTGNSATFRGKVFEPKSILCGYPKI